MNLLCRIVLRGLGASKDVEEAQRYIAGARAHIERFSRQGGCLGKAPAQVEPSARTCHPDPNCGNLHSPRRKLGLHGGQKLAQFRGDGGVVGH